MAGQLNITNQRLHHIVGTGEQLELIAFDARDALAMVAKLKQRTGNVAMLGGKNFMALLKIVEPAGGRRPHGAGALCATFTQMQFAKREISDNAHQRQNIDHQQPGHGRCDGASLHQHA